MHINPTTRELAISINLKKMGWKMNNIRFIIKKKKWNKNCSYYSILEYKLKTFSKIFTLLRLISKLRVTDNMYTFYNLFLLLLSNTYKSSFYKKFFKLNYSIVIKITLIIFTYHLKLIYNLIFIKYNHT